MRHRAYRFYGILLLSTILLLLISFQSVEAQVITPFKIRYKTNIEGNISIIGNSQLTCKDKTSRCENARMGKGSDLNNNNYNMVYVDIDEDRTTFNSTTSTLQLPDGAAVLFAGLYWGAYLEGKAYCTDENGQPCADPGARAQVLRAPSPDQRTEVLLKLPGSDDYTPIRGEMIGASSVNNDYHAFKDITSLIKSAGSGDYSLANLQVGQGYDSHGGWGLVIVYADPKEPARNLVVYDGYAHVDNRQPSVHLPIDGFNTPLSGDVFTRLGVLAYEGDLGYNGDSLLLNNKTISDPVNPPNNFFNSTISLAGSYVESRNRNDINNFGLDIDLVDADNVLPNGATSATITLTSASEQYYPGVVTFATDLYAPKIDASKTLRNINRERQNLPGDILEYSITIRNSADDRALKTILYDPIPSHTTYVPDSLKIIDGANAGQKTDVFGDDQAEFDVTGNRVVFRLGEGADASNGGAVAKGNETKISFQVRINTNAPDDALISNQARINYIGETLGSEISTVSNIVSFNVPNPAPPQINPVKTQQNLTRKNGYNKPGDIIEYTITILNTGQDAAYNTFIDDRIPENTTYVPDTLVVISGANPGPKTDDSGDDQAEISSDNVRFRVGDGADATYGGRFANNEGTSVRFHVRINADTVHRTKIDNISYAGFRSETLDLGFVVPSNVTTLEVYNPIFPRFEVFKSLKNLSRETCMYMPGDVVQYLISIKNIGKDTAINTILTDNIPNNTTYVPNSLEITSGLNSGNKSDQSGDDHAEFDVTRNRIKFRLGSGADATNGGIMEPEVVSTIVFQIRINDGVPDKTMVENQARVTAKGNTSGRPLYQYSNIVDFEISNPPPNPCADIFIEGTAPTTQIEPGGTLNSVFKIKNLGVAIANDATFTVDLPDGIAADSVTSTQGYCKMDKSIICQIGTIETTTAVTVTVNSRILNDTQPGVLNLRASVFASNCDPCLGNNINSWQVTIQNPLFQHCPKPPK